MRICFDMDGTIANLYGVENWLAYLIAEDVKPYREAEVLVNMNSLARILNKLQRNGHEIGVISWTAKNGSKRYNEAVENAKHDYELPPVHYTVVRAALKQMGVGGDDSWGAKTHPEYLIDVSRDLEFKFRFRGI